MISLVKSDLFTGLAHPDSIKCFNYLPPIDLSNIYLDLANDLNHHNMYAEQSGGLALNYHFSELGRLCSIGKNVDIRFASDAHRPEDVGANIQKMMSLFT